LYGSLSMNRALMAAGLVDRVQLTLFSVITGLDAILRGAADFDLELITSRTLDGHIQELIYRPTCMFERTAERPCPHAGARQGRSAWVKRYAGIRSLR